MESVLRLIYPPHCLLCDAATDSDFGLCASCWTEAPFVTGLACDTCGVPLPGEPGEGTVICDDCLTIARPWNRGRAALAYQGLGRRIPLALKHGDRTDLAAPAGRWMAGAAAPMIGPDTVIVPVPLHWTRLFRRRFNQAALLARVIGAEARRPVIPDLLVRTRSTASLGARSRIDRFAELADAIAPNRPERLDGRPVLLVDDVMTSGATLAAAAEALNRAGAASIDIAVLARAAKDT